MDGSAPPRTEAATAPEADLVDRASSGDADAFSILVTQHRTLIWAVCLRVTGNAFDAEDALQETLIDAWRGIARFRQQASFGTWVYRIASNAAVRVARRRRDIPVDVLPEDRPDRDFTQSLADADVVHRALREVPEDFRAALVLYELCDLTYAQVAEHQGIGIQTVKSRISRGRAALAATAAAHAR